MTNLKEGPASCLILNRAAEPMAEVWVAAAEAGEGC